MFWTSPNGTSASAPIAVRIAIAGAIRNRKPTEVRWPERLLDRELDDLGHRLQQPERSDAVGAVAALEAAQELALVDGQHRQDRERTSEDHERLDDLDPPGLEVVDSATTWITACAPRSVLGQQRLPSRRDPSARNAAPAGTPVRTRRSRCRRVPFWRRPRPSSPWAMPEARRVLGGELDLLVGDRVVQRRGDLDLGRGPDRAVAAEPQRAVGAAPRGGLRASRRGCRRHGVAGGHRRRLRRARASARRGRRSPRASARRRTEPPRRAARTPSALVSTPQVRPARLAMLRDHRPAGAHLARDARSRCAAAASGRRDGRPCLPSRRGTRPGRSRWRARGCPRSAPTRARRPAPARCIARSHSARSGRSRTGSVWSRYSAVISPSAAALRCSAAPRPLTLELGVAGAGVRAARPPRAARGRWRPRGSRAARRRRGRQAERVGERAAAPPAAAPSRSPQRITTSSPPSRSSSASARASSPALPPASAAVELGDERGLAARARSGRPAWRWRPARSAGRSRSRA